MPSLRPWRAARCTSLLTPPAVNSPWCIEWSICLYIILCQYYISNIYIYIYTYICFCPSAIILSVTYTRKKNTHQNVLYDPRWSKWYRNGALALTNRAVILLKPQKTCQSWTGWRFGDRNCLPAKTKDLTLRGWKIWSFISLIDTYMNACGFTSVVFTWKNLRELAAWFFGYPSRENFHRDFQS